MCRSLTDDRVRFLMFTVCTCTVVPLRPLARNETARCSQISTLYPMRALHSRCDVSVAGLDLACFYLIGVWATLFQPPPTVCTLEYLGCGSHPTAQKRASKAAVGLRRPFGVIGNDGLWRRWPGTAGVDMRRCERTED